MSGQTFVGIHDASTHSHNLLLTGASGFLGSHVLLFWMERYPDAQVLCPVRGPNAKARLTQTLASSARDAGILFQAETLFSRITVVEADLQMPTELSHCLQGWQHILEGVHVLHCAANLSFREEERDAVFASNVGGTRNLLAAIAGLPVLSFNYVSTAYVAGHKQGRVFEDDREPSGFNNAYEESKWQAELLVRENTAIIGMRIFRPSIVIGHTATHRISSSSGLYKVVEMLHRLGFNRGLNNYLVQVPTSPCANLNLIPVDIVVEEMLAIINCGAKTLGGIYHLTNERPLSIADVFFGISPLTGMKLECTYEENKKTSDPLTTLVLRQLRHYLPYLIQNRVFDRRNVHACQASSRQEEFWLDLVRLRQFVQTFLAETAQQVTAEDITHQKKELRP